MLQSALKHTLPTFNTQLFLSTLPNLTPKMSSLNTDPPPPPAYAEQPGKHAPPTDIKPQPASESIETQAPPEHIPKDMTQLEVDFTWRNFTARIYEPGTSNTKYIVDYRTLKSPPLLFKDASTDEIVGSGTLHPISINADYELHGEKGKLKALRHFHTEYTHLSRTFSKTEAPVAMHWVSDADFKTWDFICKGPDGVPVAKFSSNSWDMKKMGMIEFYGQLGLTKAAQEEIIVVGLTLFSCMVLRASSILSFFGGIFARPGPLRNPEAEKLGEQDTK